jgi:Helicase conserved C-terminal domain
VPDPLLTVLHPGSPASGQVVAGALAKSLAPEESMDPPPAWLQAEQIQSFRRTLAALRRHRGAVLADPVGSGKTYIALAVAAALNRGPTVCLVPAILRPQWEGTAAQLGVPVRVCSHEQASRGRLPEGTRGLVILDESHHFRNLRTRRYRNVASWLVGRAALLVSATPVVNRSSDLAHQLLLSVRDDALLLDGVLSLRALLARGCTNSALGQLVIERNADGEQRPRGLRQVSLSDNQEDHALENVLCSLQSLRLSSSASVAALIRGILLRAAASSPAAGVAALDRYRRLLLHARDALRMGGTMNRSMIRRFTAELSDQLIWWELMDAVGPGCDLDLTDLDRLDQLIATVASAGSIDKKLMRLSDLLSDGIPTLIFTGFRETVRYLREQLGGPGIAWCTGGRAGIGRTPLARADVLGWFQGNLHSTLGPRHLIATDVAAEGLNLQRAGRVVHYDLPWTPMRLHQREGRSLRSGSPHSEVQIVRFSPPAALERILGIERVLTQKGRVPADLGLGAGGAYVWRWRGELAKRFSTVHGSSGVASIVHPSEGMLAGFELRSSGDGPAWLSRTVVWLEADGSWTESAAVLNLWLDRAAGQFAVRDIRLRKWLTVLSSHIKERAGLVAGRRWSAADPTPAVKAVTARLHELITVAARLHQPARLEELEHALSFALRGHTSGEAAIMAGLAQLNDADFVRGIAKLPAAGLQWAPVDARLTGLIIFGPDSDGDAGKPLLSGVGPS